MAGPADGPARFARWRRARVPALFHSIRAKDLCLVFFGFDTEVPRISP